MNEVAQDLPTARRVRHFGMQVQPKTTAMVILGGSVRRVLGRRHRTKPFGQSRQFVSMRIPHLEFLRQLTEQLASRILNGQSAFAELTFSAWLDFAAQK